MLPAWILRAPARYPIKKGRTRSGFGLCHLDALSRALSDAQGHFLIAFCVTSATHFASLAALVQALVQAFGSS